MYIYIIAAGGQRSRSGGSCSLPTMTQECDARMIRKGRNIAGLRARGTLKTLLAAVLTVVLATAPDIPARASVGPAIPVPVPVYNSPAGSGNHNANGDKYFGDGYTSLDDTTELIYLDWVIYLHWLPPHMNMAQQLTTNMTYQVLLVGSLFDAKNEQETQRLMQQMAAEAHRDYQTDMTMCTFGTNVRSLAATDYKERANTRILDLTILKRDKLSANLSNAASVDEDLHNRFDQFKRTYCDVNDDNGYLANICEAGISSARINNDIDYTKMVENRYTIDGDFTDPNPDAGEVANNQDIIALTRNLIGFRTFNKISDDYLGQDFAKDTYQDTRSVNAMRSVASNSIAHIIGMRMAGTPCATCVGSTFMRPVLAQLGVPDADMDAFMGQNPSYYAQMEVLTHKIFENEAIVTNLYTTPANVERIGVSLQALKLMQDRDRFESGLRREMLLSQILELQIRERQGHVLSDIQGATNTLIGNPE